MMAAAAAWDDIGRQLESVATGYSSTISSLQGQHWSGPASNAMAAAATRYLAWATATAAQAEQTAAQIRAVAGAYETAFAATVPPAAVAANRSQLAMLVATNFFGQNLPAIAATEAVYAEMWAQDATAMYGYAGASAQEGLLTPFSLPTETTVLGGQSDQQAAGAAAFPPPPPPPGVGGPTPPPGGGAPPPPRRRRRGYANAFGRAAFGCPRTAAPSRHGTGAATTSGHWPGHTTATGIVADSRAGGGFRPHLGGTGCGSTGGVHDRIAGRFRDGDPERASKSGRRRRPGDPGRHGRCARHNPDRCARRGAGGRRKGSAGRKADGAAKLVDGNADGRRR